MRDGWGAEMRGWLGYGGVWSGRGTVGFRTSDRLWMVGMVGVGSNSHEQLARATRTRRRPRRKGPNLAGPTVVSFRAVLECTNAVLRQAKLPNYFLFT